MPQKTVKKKASKEPVVVVEDRPKGQKDTATLEKEIAEPGGNAVHEEETTVDAGANGRPKEEASQRSADAQPKARAVSFAADRSDEGEGYFEQPIRRFERGVPFTPGGRTPGAMTPGITPGGRPNSLPAHLQRLPTQITAIDTPPLARPQSMIETIAVSMATVPSTVAVGVENVVNSGPVVLATDTVAAGASAAAGAVASALPFDVEVFRDLASILVEMIYRNAHELPPLDVGELLLCLGMYCHYHLQRALDEEDEKDIDAAEMFQDTPLVTEREPYTRFMYCIDFAEAAYASDMDTLLEWCPKLPSADSVIDVEHNSNAECPSFFLAVDLKAWKIVLAIRGTASLHDAVVDLKLDCVPFLDGHAHSGMAHLATNLLKRILPKLTHLRHQHPNFDLYVTGHSLGAGIASLITLVLTSDEYKAQFPSVHGVCFATPACCTENLTTKAEHVTDSLVLGYDVVPALSEKSLIWLLRELQKFSKENEHRRLFSEAWYKQVDSVYESMQQNPRTKIFIDAWESNVVTSVRRSVGNAAVVAKETVVDVVETAQDAAVSVVEGVADTVVSLQEAGYVPPEPSLVRRCRRRIVGWLIGLHEDACQTSTLLTLTMTLGARTILGGRTLKFTALAASASIIGQIGYMRWKRRTQQKLEYDLDQAKKATTAKPPSNRSASKKPAQLSFAAQQALDKGDPVREAPTKEGDDQDLKVLLTPATLYYLRDWVDPAVLRERRRLRLATKEQKERAEKESESPPRVEGADVARAINESSNASASSSPVIISGTPPPDDEATQDDKEDGPPPIQHVLVRSLPNRFTEIQVNVRMIDDHLISSYRRALGHIVWDITQPSES
ncbi:hypothetical protein DFS34DRAFT_499434 [Phlyctochytrium arcticum]|nr:hypothetical protein DFS34DRAFT_499434 [Phlyctochytrium arcticum]